MFSADSRHKNDQYNDASKYGTTGELMEISFQPLFIEGVADGSSRRVIRSRPNYPEGEEDVGITTFVNPRTGQLVYNNRPPLADSSNAPGMGGAGPTAASWKEYLQKRNQKRSFGGEYDPNKRARIEAPVPLVAMRVEAAAIDTNDEAVQVTGTSTPVSEEGQMLNRMAQALHTSATAPAKTGKKSKRSTTGSGGTTTKTPGVYGTTIMISTAMSISKKNCIMPCIVTKHDTVTSQMNTPP